MVKNKQLLHLILLKKLNKKENHVFDQWEMTLLDNLTDYFNLKNGYTEDIPVFDDKIEKCCTYKYLFTS